MVKRKRRSFGRDLRPESTTSERWTNIKKPIATERFKIGERVAWDEGDKLILAEVAGFTVNDCEIQVRLENGNFKIWPTISPRLRRVQTPDYEAAPSMVTPSTKKIVDSLTSDAYSSIEFDEEEEDLTKPVEKIDLDDTIAGDDWDG